MFQGTLVELETELREAGCGIEIQDGGGKVRLVSCIAYVDDIALLAPDMESLRKAIKIAGRWAARMWMRLNVGPGKSAVMAYGRGRLSGKEKRARLYIGEKKLEVVKSYKYLGLVIS
jgi:hypothetical protein